MSKHAIKFIQSFKYAFNGIKEAFDQRNIKIQFVCGIFIVIAGVLFNINNSEWISLVIVIFSVIAAELFNTAIEETCNCQRDHLGASYESTRVTRDIAAGAVLITSICAFIVGAIIFLPKFF